MTCFLRSSLSYTRSKDPPIFAPTRRGFLLLLVVSVILRFDRHLPIYKSKGFGVACEMGGGGSSPQHANHTAEGVVESLKMRRKKRKREEASSHASQMKIGQKKEEREKMDVFCDDDYGLLPKAAEGKIVWTSVLHILL